MTDTLIADMYRALLTDAPKGEIPGWLPARRWVLSPDTVRLIGIQQGSDPDDVDFGLEHPYVASSGYLLGLPYRVDATVEGYILEPIDEAKR